MSMKRCNNGHFYDDAKHPSCPYCGISDMDASKTMPIIDWAYECSDCKKYGHEKAVKIDNLKHVAEAVAVAGMVSTPDALKWLHRLTAALMEQTEK